MKNKPLPIEVQKKLARLDAFVTLNPRPVIEMDFDGNVLDMNENARRLFPDLKRKGGNHAYLSKFRQIVKILLKEGEFGRDIKVGKKWYKQRFYRVPQFNLIHIYGSDATERKQAEEYLRASELRYRSLFNKMSEGYMLFEVLLDKSRKPYDYRFIDINPAFEKITGLRRSFVVGKTLKQLSMDTDPKIIRQYAKVALTGKPIHEESFSQDLNKHFEIYAYKTDPLKFAVLFFDITNRKHLEKEKDNFISILSHELRNPLTPILAAGQLMQSRFKKDGGDGLQEYADTIVRQSSNMARLLDDLLDMSRITHKTMRIDKRVTSLNEAIEHATGAVKPYIKNQQQKLTISLPKKPLYVLADPVRLEQIIVNLMSNASKYTRPKGSIAVYAKTFKGMAHITVKDNGVGIKPKKIKRIFELFYTDNRPFNDLGSLGIGLNITKQLVTMHGGKIFVESPGENKGSTFTVKLPQVMHKHKKPNKIATQKSITKSHVVLVVDDNKDIAHMLSRILTDAGNTVKTVYSGEEALQAAEKFSPSVALVDIGLPGISGYEVAKALRRMHKKILLVATTGYGQVKDKVNAKTAGFDHHLVKPINIDSLIKIIT